MSDKTDIETIERLTRLEAENKQIMRILEGADGEGGLAETLRDVNARLTKYETRWGMIVMLLSALGAAFVAFKDWLLHKLG